MRQTDNSGPARDSRVHRPAFFHADLNLSYIRPLVSCHRLVLFTSRFFTKLSFSFAIKAFICVYVLLTTIIQENNPRLTKNVRNHVQRSSREESQGEMQPRRHDRRFEEIDSRTDRNTLGKDCPEKMVHHLQGSHKTSRL